MSNQAHWVTITYLLEGGTREDKSWICLSSIRIAEECQRASVREICITDEVPDYVGGKEPSLWIIGGQEFDDAEPVFLILPARLEIVFVLRSPRSPDPYRFSEQASLILHVTMM